MEYLYYRQDIIVLKLPASFHALAEKTFVSINFLYRKFRIKTWPVYILTKKGKAAKTIPARISM
jgi:hypothetical protein